MKTEQAEDIIFAGGFSASQLIILGIVLTILLGILFWRDLRLAQRRAIVPYLFVLRLLAVAGVLFALAEPTHLTEVKTSRPNAFGIYLDDSASMKLTDHPDGLGSALRWSQLPEAAPSHLADTWVARLGAIRIQLHQSLQSGDREVYSKIHREAQQLFKDIDSERKQVNRPELFTRLSDFLDQQLIPSLAGLASESDTAARRSEARTLLIESAQELTSLQQLADQIAADLETQIIASGKLTREEQRWGTVKKWLQNSRSTWLKDLQKKAQVRNFTFSDEVHPQAGTSWSTTPMTTPRSSPTPTSARPCKTSPRTTPAEKSKPPSSSLMATMSARIPAPCKFPEDFPRPPSSSCLSAAPSNKGISFFITSRLPVTLATPTSSPSRP